MANTRSAKKAARQTERRTVSNKARRTRMRSSARKVEEAIASGNRETAEELTVDVFHSVWRRASSYDAAVGPVLGWIMNQARSQAVDRVRYDNRQKRTNTHADDTGTHAAASDVAASLDLAELGGVLRKALAVLTKDERTAIEQAFFADMTYAAVATRLQEPLGTIKTRIRSGLAKLRQALDRGTVQS